MKNNVSI